MMASSKDHPPKAHSLILALYFHLSTLIRWVCRMGLEFSLPTYALVIYRQPAYLSYIGGFGYAMRY
jgi:hypothetical protein